MVSHDKFAALHALLANVLVGSAVIEQPVEMDDYRYEKVRLRVEQIAYPMFSPRDIQSCHVKILAASVCALVFDDRNSVITMKSSPECFSTDFAMEGAVVLQDGRKVAEEGIKMILMDARHSCSAVCHLKV